MTETGFDQNNKSLELIMKDVIRQVEQDREKIIGFSQNLRNVKHPVFPAIPAAPQI